MKTSWITVTVILALAIRKSGTEAKILFLRPLSGKQVKWALKEANPEDAIREGRTLRAGLAAVGGFGLGLAKGFVGTLLFELWAANVNITELYETRPQVTTSEICFSSRSIEPDNISIARSVDSTDYEDDYEYNENDDGVGVGDDGEGGNGGDEAYNEVEGTPRAKRIRNRNRILASNANDPLTCLIIQTNPT